MDEGNGWMERGHGRSVRVSPLPLGEGQGVRAWYELQKHGMAAVFRSPALTLTLSQRERELPLAWADSQYTRDGSRTMRGLCFPSAPGRRARRTMRAGRCDRRGSSPDRLQTGRQCGASLLGQLLRRLQEHDGSAALVDHRPGSSRCSVSQRNGSIGCRCGVETDDRRDAHRADNRRRASAYSFAHPATQIRRPSAAFRNTFRCWSWRRPG